MIKKILSLAKATIAITIIILTCSVSYAADARLAKYGVEYVLNFDLYETDGVDFKIDASDTGTDTMVRKDQGADTTATNDFVDEGLSYSLTVTATEMQAKEILVHFTDKQVTKVYLDRAFLIQTYGNASALHAFDLDTATQDVNTIQISGDSTAADNLELMYDGTGYIADTAPASRSQVDNIGAASGGAVNFAPIHDNTIKDTIDNASADLKGGGLVGIPVTGHAFIAGNEVTIANTTSYDGAHTLVSVSASEVVITHSQDAEAFGGSETIVSSIHGVIFVGTVSSGTFADVGPGTANSHSINDDGDDIDIIYDYQVGGGRIATSLLINADVDGGADQLGIEVYDHVGDVWDVLGEIDDNDILTIPLTIKYTGTGSELGKVHVRYDNNDPDTPANLEVFECLIAAVNIGQTVGYANGKIWVDTVSGTAGSEDFVNGVADNPVLTWADALTLSASTGLTDFHILNGSSITLTASSDNFSLFGDNWTLNLGTGAGQSCDGAYLQGAHGITGTATSAEEIHFEGCEFGTATIALLHADFCSFTGTITQSTAGDYNYHNCYSGVAGAGSPTFTKTSGQAITAEYRNWSGGMTQSGIESGDTFTISGELGTVTLNGADGTVEIRGSYKAIVDNRGGSPTLNLAGAWKGKDIADTLLDTAEIGTAGAGLTNINLPNQTMDIVGDITGNLSGSIGSLGATAKTDVNTEVDNALDTALPASPTGGSINDIFDIQEETIVYGSAATGTLSTTEMTTDLTVTVNDQFNGRIITFRKDTTTAALRGQQTDITDTVTTNGKLTFTAITTAPVNGDKFVIN